MVWGYFVGLAVSFGIFFSLPIIGVESVETTFEYFHVYSFIISFVIAYTMILFSIGFLLLSMFEKEAKVWAIFAIITTVTLLTLSIINLEKIEPYNQESNIKQEVIVTNVVSSGVNPEIVVIKDLKKEQEVLPTTEVKQEIVSTPEVKEVVEESKWLKWENLWYLVPILILYIIIINFNSIMIILGEGTIIFSTWLGVYMISGMNIFTELWSNPLILGFALVINLFIGLLWSMFRWKEYSKSKKVKNDMIQSLGYIQDEWVEMGGIPEKTEYNTGYSETTNYENEQSEYGYDYEKYKEYKINKTFSSYMHLPRDNKGMISYFIFMWHLDVMKFFMFESIKKVINGIIVLMKDVYGNISKRILKKISEGM